MLKLRSCAHLALQLPLCFAAPELAMPCAVPLVVSLPPTAQLGEGCRESPELAFCAAHKREVRSLQESQEGTLRHRDSPCKVRLQLCD